MQQPGKRDLGDAGALGGCDFPHRLDGGIAAIHVHGREIEGGAAAIIATAFPVILAGEVAACQRAPHHQANLLGRQHGDDFAFKVAPRQGVIRLQRNDGGKLAQLGDADGFHHLPGGPVGEAQIVHGAFPDERVQRFEGFFHWHYGIKPVDLVEVDMIEAQAFEACFCLVKDMPARGAAVVRAFRHRAKDFRGDHDLVPGHTQFAQRLAKDLLAAAE